MLNLYNSGPKYQMGKRGAAILTSCSGAEATRPLYWADLKVVLDTMREKCPLNMAVRWPNAAWTSNR